MSFESEEKLLEFYRKDLNYLKLKNGELGGNLIYKYKSKSLTEAKLGWIDYLAEQLFENIHKILKKINLEKIKKEIEEIRIFTIFKLEGFWSISQKSPLSNMNSIMIC